MSTIISEKSSLNKNNYETIPGAEPTPPPDPSPDSYPKIRIKTTGLLKDPIESTCTITEITDDNPNGNPHQGKFHSLLKITGI